MRAQNISGIRSSPVDGYGITAKRIRIKLACTRIIFEYWTRSWRESAKPKPFINRNGSGNIAVFVGPNLWICGAGSGFSKNCVPQHILLPNAFHIFQIFQFPRNIAGGFLEPTLLKWSRRALAVADSTPHGTRNTWIQFSCLSRFMDILGQTNLITTAKFNQIVCFAADAYSSSELCCQRQHRKCAEITFQCQTFLFFPVLSTLWNIRT